MPPPRDPWWNLERDSEPRSCALCGARGPLFAGHSPRDGRPIDRCEDMAACRARSERKVAVS